MRQTSEQFAQAMLEDIENEVPKTSIAEQLAEMEKRINDRIQQTQDNIFSKFEQSQVNALDEPSDEPTNEETIETVENENEGE